MDKSTAPPLAKLQRIILPLVLTYPYEKEYLAENRITSPVVGKIERYEQTYHLNSAADKGLGLRATDFVNRQQESCANYV